MKGDVSQVEKILRSTLERLALGGALSLDESRAIFDVMMQGSLDACAIAALLGAFAVKRETVEELVGAARAMRARAVVVRCDDPDAIDTCGTGGDGVSTFNVSSTAAIIAAAAGATVAKHGNRSSTRLSGSTEVLTELGIDVEAGTGTVENCIREAKIGYLNARLLHPAMKAVAQIRQAIPVRTIFNLLGPLTNPAGVRRQLVGVPRPELVEKMGSALLQLGAVRAWVVHGHSGICDVSITGPSMVCEVRDGAVRTFEVTPEDAGLPRGDLKELLVDSPRHSASAVSSILRGEPGAGRNHALLNAGAALVVAGLAKSIAEAVHRAASAVDSGAAAAKLAQWVKFQGPSTKDK